MVGVDSVHLLQKVLLLEREQGFANRSATGGLEAFALIQLERADTASRDELTQAVVKLHGYISIDHQLRAAAVEQALEALASTEGARHHPVKLSPRPSGSITKNRSAAPFPPELDSPVSTLKGVGPSLTTVLNKVGITSIRDLIFYFPRTHYDYTDTRSISRIRLGQKTTLVGTIESVRTSRTSRGTSITTAVVIDSTGAVSVRWFNQAFREKGLPVGSKIAVTGEPEIFNGRFYFQPRDFELIERPVGTHTARLVPIYALTKGLFQRSLRQLVFRTLESHANQVEEHLSGDLRQRFGLPELSLAVRGFHFPSSEEDRRRSERRLAFDELLLVQIGLQSRKSAWQQPYLDVAIAVDETLHERFCSSLPFALTSAQRRVMGEILADLRRSTPMSRLIQGDVGSGKTVVAAAALLQTAKSGRQAALMAPTEILAEQHFRTVTALLETFDVRCELLVGSTTKSQRSKLHTSLQDGSVHVIVGTHALIQLEVAFQSLGLAITDEQHRFGVEQRGILRQKGLHPHILAMTATPIPRTLALTIYGDLDVSSLDEMPPGRLRPVTTWANSPAEAYRVVRNEVGRGHQAFVICPVIEESMDSDMRSVLAEHRELQRLIFADLNVGLLHGRLKAREKDAVLDRFRRGETHILVATSVIEVGIDVPNATVMLIRDAHRFGLAQLHQFRGRVGRGGDQAYCVLLSPTEGVDARERLDALTATDDGFELAEKDLELRGPGEFWGIRQSGLPELRVARLTDVATIQCAREAAQTVLSHDPKLTSPSNLSLRRAVDHFWAETADLS